MTVPLARDARIDIEAHTWRLRDIEFEDGATTMCFECTECGSVRYE